MAPSSERPLKTVLPQALRNLHVVIATVGRPTCAGVARDAIEREHRLARLTIVTQGGQSVVDADLARAAEQRSIVLGETVLPEPIGPGRARHIGAVQGDEEFVGFLDDDIRFESGSLSMLVDGCERAGLGGACGVIRGGEVGLVGALAKTISFRSIFRDPRPWATRTGRSAASDLLSGGMTVYRRAGYAPAAAAWLELAPSARGEDVELSYAVSRHARLEVNPSVQVRNLSAESPADRADASANALRYLERYRNFAMRHATARRHWIAYGAVVVGVTARGLAAGAGAGIARAAANELSRALHGAARPRAGVKPR